MKSKGGKNQRREEKKKEDQRKKSLKKEDAGARKGRKVANHHVFPVVCGSRGSNCTLWREAQFEVQMLKTPQRQSAFSS